LYWPKKEFAKPYVGGRVYFTEESISGAATSTRRRQRKKDVIGVKLVANKHIMVIGIREAKDPA
jgi:hypothetical protein